MLRKPAGALAFAILLFVVTYGAAGRAFCRTTTCENCEMPPQGCITDGIPLYWPTACISYSMQQDASDTADLQTATDIAGLAFSAWEGAICPSGESPFFRLERSDAVTCDRHEYNDQQTTFGGNANIIVFRDDEWTATQDPHTLALTTVTYNKNTGEIYDADIEVNSHIRLGGMQGISTETPVPPNKFDLQSILTHEAGHFLGLAHSLVGCASSPGHCPTMDAAYRTGSGDFRDLEPDDVAGICSIYARDRAVSDQSCMPRHGFSGECGTAGHKGCCSTAPGGASSRHGQGMFAALVGLGLWALRGRRASA